MKGNTAFRSAYSSKDNHINDYGVHDYRTESSKEDVRTCFADQYVIKISIIFMLVDHFVRVHKYIVRGLPGLIKSN